MRISVKEIARVIRERRETLNITQADLAEISAIGLRTVQKIENGEGNPTMDVLEKLLKTLGLELYIDIAKSHE